MDFGKYVKSCAHLPSHKTKHFIIPPVPQDSCLENPMDRGAWWATLHGVRRIYIGRYQQQMFVKAGALELETGSV